MKAHFRLAICLYELGKLQDSLFYLNRFTMKYPLYKTSTAFKVLHRDVLLAYRKSDTEKIDGM